MEVSEELELSGICLEGPQVNQWSRKPNGEAREILRTKHTKDKHETGKTEEMSTGLNSRG